MTEVSNPASSTGRDAIAPRSAIAFAGATTAIAFVIFAPILYYMVLTWKNIDDYSHGFLVGPLAIYFAWERRADLRRATVSQSWWGLVPLVLGAIALMVGRLGVELMAMRVAFVLTIIGLGTFITALDQTVVVTALPSVMLDLQVPIADLDRAAWVITAYLLGYTVAMPLIGRLGDVERTVPERERANVVQHGIAVLHHEVLADPHPLNTGRKHALHLIQNRRLLGKRIRLLLKTLSHIDEDVGNLAFFADDYVFVQQAGLVKLIAVAQFPTLFSHLNPLAIRSRAIEGDNTHNRGTVCGVRSLRLKGDAQSGQ